MDPNTMDPCVHVAWLVELFPVANRQARILFVPAVRRVAGAVDKISGGRGWGGITASRAGRHGAAGGHPGRGNDSAGAASACGVRERMCM